MKDIKNLENEQNGVSDKVKELGKQYETGLKSLENLDHKQTDLSTKFVNMEREIRTDMKAIENQQSEVSNKIKKQENDLNRLKIDLSRDDRAGKYFYRLTDVGKFFEIRKRVDSEIFLVKGMRSFFHFATMMLIGLFLNLGTPFYLRFTVENKESSDYLGIYLCPTVYSTGSNVKVYYELSLISFNDKNDFTHHTTKIFKKGDYTRQLLFWHVFSFVHLFKYFQYFQLAAISE